MNNDLEERYLNLIDNNVNVSKIGAGTEFLYLVAALGIICFSIFFFADAIANIVIDNMPNKWQVELEKKLSFGQNSFTESNKHADKIKYLESVKTKIVRMDKRLQNKSPLTIHEINEEQVNAFVYPDGNIYFTSKLLEKVDDKESLTFVLGHELGHYAHRDHLKSIGRELISGTILFVITLGNKDIASTIGNINSMNQLNHSQRQEKAADMYGNKILYKLYGRNTGAVKFFKFLKEEENIPEFFYYFSTHPSTEQRLNLIQRNK